jgi:hypothetical protein
VSFAGLFGNQPQVLTAAGTVLVRLGQIVNDSLPRQMPRQGWRPPRFWLDVSRGVGAAPESPSWSSSSSLSTP